MFVSLSIISSEISFMVFLALLEKLVISKGIPVVSLAMFIIPLVILSVDSDLLFQVSPINLLKACRKGSNETAVSSCISSQSP